MLKNFMVATAVEQKLVVVLVGDLLVLGVMCKFTEAQYPKDFTKRLIVSLLKTAFEITVFGNIDILLMEIAAMILK